MCRRRVSPSPYLIIIIIPHLDTQVTQGCQIERPAPGEPNMSSDTPGTKSHTTRNLVIRNLYTTTTLSLPANILVAKMFSTNGTRNG